MFGLKKDCDTCKRALDELATRTERLEKQRKADLADYHDLADKVNHWMKRTDQRVRQAANEQGSSGSPLEDSADSMAGAPRPGWARRILTRRRGSQALPREET